MQQNQRARVLMARPGMDVVHSLSVNDGTELRPGIQSRFDFAPVELGGPVRAEFPQVIDVGTAFPRRSWNLIRPPRLPQPGSEVVLEKVSFQTLLLIQFAQLLIAPGINAVFAFGGS